MSLDVLFAGIGGLIIGLSGIYIAIHETRRRERRVTRREIDDLTREVEALRALLLEQRRWIYDTAMIMIDHGIDVPRPPGPSFDRDEYT